MRVGAVILKLRYDQLTGFGNYVGGAVEFAMTSKGTLLRDMLFVVPLDEGSNENEYDNSINQRVEEKFGVIVALKNDHEQGDMFGLIAYERLHNIRKAIWKSLLMWEVPDGESLISFRGGRLLDINPAYMWYQYDFSYTSRLTSEELTEKAVEGQTEKIHEVAEEIAKEESGESSTGKYANMSSDDLTNLIPNKDVPRDFNTIYMQLIQWPSEDLPYTGELPVADGYPDVTLPNMANWIDMTKHPDDGAFGRGFADGFYYYKIHNRRST